MANSRYEYVRNFELSDRLLPNTWIVIRIDGRGFHKWVLSHSPGIRKDVVSHAVIRNGPFRLSAKYKFAKPNDMRALELMNSAAKAVMKELPDIILAYGHSDEFSFVFRKACTLFERRQSKLITTVVSTFTAFYIHRWRDYFPGIDLSAPLPTFDGRAIQYPTDQNLKDYLSWRQVDCHINNLYNTTFWAMVQKGGIKEDEAELQLKGSLAADKNEILFSRYNINYNNEPEMFKKGSVIMREINPMENLNSAKARKLRAKAEIKAQHIDIINERFWVDNPWLLSDSAELKSNNK